MVAAAAAVTGWVLIRLVGRSHAIALTSQRLLVIRRSARSGQLGAIEGAYPRSAIRLIGYRPGTLFGSLKVDLAGESILSLSLLSSARRGAGQIADALKVASAA